MGFKSKLLQAIKKNNSYLCLGLDPYPELLPINDPLLFNLRIIQATHDLVCAYKLNLAFYEAMGIEGLKVLEKTLNSIPKDIPSIGDGKRGDIGSASYAYARSLFDIWGFDAITVNPYLGYDSIEPFLSRRDRGVFILCRSSNPGSKDFQEGVFEEVARKALKWNRHGNVGLIVGANYPETIRRIKMLCPEMLLLLPGVGAQGGKIREAVLAAKENFIISISRSILYASGGDDFDIKAREAALSFRDDINLCLNEVHYRDKRL